MTHRENRVLAHTGARYPIVQAPMGLIATGRFAAAVWLAWRIKPADRTASPLV